MSIYTTDEEKIFQEIIARSSTKYSDMARFIAFHLDELIDEMIVFEDIKAPNDKDFYIDSLKLKFIDKFLTFNDEKTIPSCICKIAKSLTSDLKKLDAIDRFDEFKENNDYYKKAIIDSINFESDSFDSRIEERAVKILSKIKDEEFCKKIVLKFKNEKNIMAGLKYVPDKYRLSVVKAKSYELSDESIVSLISSAKKEEILPLAKLLDSDEARLEVINKVLGKQDEEIKVQIARYLCGDRKHSRDLLKELLVLPHIYKFYNRIDLIQSFDDEEKSESLEEKEISELARGIQGWIEYNKKYPQPPLNLPRELTIGVELEANGLLPSDTKSYFKQTLYKLLPNMKRWDKDIKGDGSLPHGTEIASPVLTSSKENMDELYIISRAMKELGFETDEHCGGHIHFGADFLSLDENGNLDESLGNIALKNLIDIWTNAEELFYKMSNEEGDITREEALKSTGDGYGYAAAITPICKSDTADGKTLLQALQESRYQSINFKNLKYGEKNTIEFRLSNGTIKPEVIQQNIYLYGRLMIVSKEIALHPEKYVTKLKNYTNENVSEAEKVEALLDLLFENEPQKDLYRKRWRSIRDAEIFKELYEPSTFRRGDYSLKQNISEAVSDTPKELTDEALAEINEEINAQKTNDQHQNNWQQE